jgi:DNA-binding transcriptional ArsR family regulator
MVAVSKNPCFSCGQPLTYYAALGEWWCGTATCPTRPGPPPEAPPALAAAPSAGSSPGGNGRREAPPIPTLGITDASQMAEPGPRRWRVDGFLPEGFPAILFGDGGQGKSYLALALATAVAADLPFLGLPAAPGPVLYIDWELDGEEFARRAWQVARGLGLARPPQGLLYAKAAAALEVLLAQVAEQVQARRIGLLVVDSLGPACGGDTQAERLIIPVMEALRALSLTVLAVDHQAKLQPGQDYAAKSPFGSAYKFNLARSVWQVERGERRQENTLDLLLRHRKANFGPLAPDMGVCLTFGADAVGLERVNPLDVSGLAQKLPASERVLAELRDFGEVTAEDLAEVTGLAVSTVKNALTVLRKSGQVEGRPGESQQSAWRWSLRPASRPIYSKDAGRRAD